VDDRPISMPRAANAVLARQVHGTTVIARLQQRGNFRLGEGLDQRTLEARTVDCAEVSRTGEDVH